MSDLKFKIEITATGEVRDKDGNLVSSEPVVIEKIVSEEELNALVAAQTEEN